MPTSSLGMSSLNVEAPTGYLLHMPIADVGMAPKIGLGGKRYLVTNHFEYEPHDPARTQDSELKTEH